MLTYHYLTKNKKRTFITISSVTLVTILFLCVGLLFSSIREYLITEVIKTNGSHHVSLETKEIPYDNIKKIVKKDNTFYITYKNIKDTYQNTKKICTQTVCNKITYNQKLLSLYGINQQENIVNMFMNLIIIILIVLSFGIIIIVYNSFSISVIERKKQFSLLKSIGMKKKQIRHMIISESIIILIIGLFIGFIISVNAMFFILRYINKLLSELFTSDLKLAIYPLFIIIPLLFASIVVVISALIPAIKASRTPIIDNLRGYDNYRYKKPPKIIKKLKITKKLAFYNYKRCQKKYRPIILCIFINIIIYTTFSMYLNYGIKSINDFSNLPDYDASITIKQSNENKIQALKKYAQQHSTTYNLFNSCQTKIILDKNNYLKKQYPTTNLIIISGNDNYIINRIKEVNTKDNRMVKINKPYLKDKVNLTINKQTLELPTKNKVPYGSSEYLTKENIVMITNDINKYCQTYDTTLIMKGKVNLKDSLNELAKKENIDNITYVDVKKAYKLTNNIIIAIKIILYTLIILVSLIGISSIIGSIWTSTNLRSQEFGSLISIGLTKKQMNEMLFYESLYLVVKSYILSIPTICFINYILYTSLNKVLQMTLLYPIKEIILSFCFTLIIVYLTMLLTHQKFKPQNVISLIINSNI